MRFSLLILSLFSGQVLASAECPYYPKEEWASEAALKQTLADKGYTIKKFKIDGNCYEIYGRNKRGKKIEIYFDVKTLEIVKAEVVR